MNFAGLGRVSRHLGQAIPVLLIMAVLTFMLMHLLPGDPAAVMAGPEASQQAVERIRRELGLDRPVIEQLLIWLSHLAQGNLGDSLFLNQSVLAAVTER